MRLLAGLLLALALALAPAAAAAAAGAGAGAQDPGPGLEVESVRRIWSDGNHNAFTDIVRHGDLFLCSFREGERHVFGRDGAARVIASRDGVQWDSVAWLTVQGVDLRDPKLSVLPDGRLMLLMGGSRYRGKELVGKQPHVAFSPDGVHWSEPQPVLDEGVWLWRVTWHAGTGYGVAYEPGGLQLVSTRDGLHYERIARLELTGRPNETTLRFTADGEMWAFIRREEEDRQAWIGRSVAPYTDRSFAACGQRVGGPNFIADPRGGWIGAGRAYLGPTEGTKTILGRLDAREYAPRLELPSGGDTSYPGLVWFGDKLYVSYYSSHEGTTAVYLAVLKHR